MDFPILIFIFSLVIIVYILGSIRIVRESNEALVERLGRYNRKLRPGLNCIMPFLDKVVLIGSLREQLLDLSPQLAITRDKVPLEVDVVVYWRILDLERTYYEIENAEDGIRELVSSRLRNEFGRMTFAQTFSSRDIIHSKVMFEQLDESTDPWGIKVMRIEVRSIHPLLSEQGTIQQQADNFNCQERLPEPRQTQNRRESLSDISFEEANKFCAWLSHRDIAATATEEVTLFRLSTEEERADYPLPEDKELGEKGIRLVRFKAPTRFSQLAYYLASGMWKEADQETLTLILQAVGRSEKEILDAAAIQKLPCEDLKILDQLWTQYSNNQFGFSIQRKAWIEVGGSSDSANILHLSFSERLPRSLQNILIHWGSNFRKHELRVFYRFCDRLAWRIEGNLLPYECLTFQLTAPTGHLPAIFSGKSLESVANYFPYLMSKLDECYIQ